MLKPLQKKSSKSPKKDTGKTSVKNTSVKTKGKRKNYCLELNYTDVSGYAIPHIKRCPTYDLWKMDRHIGKQVSDSLAEIAGYMGGENIRGGDIEDMRGKKKPMVMFDWKYRDRTFLVRLYVVESNYFGENAVSLDSVPDSEIAVKPLTDLLKNEIDGGGTTVASTYDEGVDEPVKDRNFIETMSKKVSAIDENIKKRNMVCFVGDQNLRDLDSDEEYPTIENISKNLSIINFKLDKILRFIDGFRRICALMSSDGFMENKDGIPETDDNFVGREKEFVESISKTLGKFSNGK